MDLRSAFTAQRDIWLNRFEFLWATEEDDIAQCRHVLEEVRDRELNRNKGAAVFTSPVVAAEDDGSRLAACRDTKNGQIVGTMRCTPAAGVAGVPSSVAEYRLDLFDEELLDRLVIFTRLCILRDYRKTVASLVFFGKGFSALMQEGYGAALLACEPNLFPMYRALGARPIGPVHNSPSGGFRVPMISFASPEYLEGSPLQKVIASADPELGRPFADWYRALVEREGEVPFGIVPYTGDEDDDDAPSHRLLTSALTPAGVEELLHNSMVVTAEAGDVIVADRDGGKSIGFVRSGMVEVRSGERVIGMLGPGEIFGEIAHVLNSTRTAKLTATVPDTELLLLSVSALNRVSSPKDREQVWRNMAWCLATRLVERTA